MQHIVLTHAQIKNNKTVMDIGRLDINLISHSQITSVV